MTFLRPSTIRRSLIPIVLLLLASAAAGFQPKKPETGLDQKAFSLPELYISNLAVPMDQQTFNKCPTEQAGKPFLHVTVRNFKSIWILVL